MAHEIDISAGRPAVFVAGQPAWHRLGKVIDAATTSVEAITLAGLDWHVDQWPIHATDPINGQIVPVDDQVANVRTDTGAVLGIVGREYRVFNNRDAFNFMDSLIGDKLAMFETAGSLKGGRRVWMLARIPSEYRAGRDDIIKPYVLLVNSHDGTMALRMIPTAIRVVCQNTLNLALRSAGREGLAIRHYASLEQRVAEARQKLGIITARFDAFDAELHAMLEGELTGKQVTRYFEGLVPPANTDRQRKNRREVIDTLQGNFENERNTLAGMRGTPWAAYNAVSEWADHQRKFRGVDDRAREESRLDSIWFGSSNRIKQDAYGAALALASQN